MAKPRKIADVVAFQVRLKELLDYDPETGVFTWRVDRSIKTKAGAVAGSVRVCGRSRKLYVKLKIDYVSYYAHRLAYIYVFGIDPPDQLDHFDCDGRNNRITNLRLADHNINSKNIKLFKKNTLGVSGVLLTKSGRYRVHLSIAGKSKNCGTYDTFAEAVSVHTRLKLLHGYHPDHGLPRTT